MLRVSYGQRCEVSTLTEEFSNGLKIDQFCQAKILQTSSNLSPNGPQPTFRAYCTQLVKIPEADLGSQRGIQCRAAYNEFWRSR